jgi:hypothetical protein
MSLDSLRRARTLGALLAIAAVPAFSGTASAASATGLDLPGTTLWTGDYETGSTSQWHGCQKSGTYSITMPTSNVRQGRYSGRYEVRDGDNPIGYGERAECQRDTNEQEGQERWYSWSTYFAPDFPVENATSGWGTFTQWHAKASGSPPVGLFLEGGKMVLKIHRQSSPGNFVGIINPWGMDFASNRGRWIDFRMRVKWSGSDSTGWIELWVDGVQQKMNWPLGGNASSFGGVGATRLRTRTLVPGYGAYYKQGFYRSVGNDGTAVIYHDAFRMTDGNGTLPDATEPPPPPSVTIGVSPSTATVPAGTTKQFTASGGTVTWSVNGVAGGNSTVGTISSSGLYTAPAVVPSGAVTVKATSTANTSAAATASVTVTAPTAPAPTEPAPAEPAPAPGTLVFSDGFEGATVGSSTSPWRGYRDSTNSFGTVATPVAGGLKSADFRKSSTGYYTYASRGFAAENSATVTVKVFLRDNVLANSNGHTILRVLDGMGNSSLSPRFQVALYRTSSGALRWGVYAKAPNGGAYTPAALSTTAPEMNRWVTLKFSTVWNSSTARGRLQVDDGTVISTPAVNMSGYQADRVEVGVLWTNAANRLRVGVDDLVVDTSGISSLAATRRVKQRYARIHEGRYRAVPRPKAPRRAKPVVRRAR